MSQFYLVYTHPKQGEQRVLLEPHRSYRLGAHADNDIVVPEKDVSRHHAVITTFDGRFQVTDLSSKNGTFVNGQRTASGEVRCGDQVSLSSASLLIVEVRSDWPEEKRVGGPAQARPKPLDPSEDTSQYRLAGSVEDVVDLLETTAAAIGRGAVSEPLSWAVERLGIAAAAVLYCDGRGGVSIVANAGDMGRLVLAHETLSRLTGEILDETPMGAPRLRQIEVLGEPVLLVRLGTRHLLLVRPVGHPPAVTDLRALIAAERAVLGAAVNPVDGSPSPAGRPAGDVEGGGGDADPLRALLGRPLTEAREAFERLRVERALAAAEGNWTAAAAALGITRTGLYKLAKRLSITV